MSSKNITSIWGHWDADKENAYTTKFLEMLIQHNYVWSSSDQEASKINLGKKEKAQFLHNFSRSVEDYFDEWTASIQLGLIQEIYTNEYSRLLAASKKTGESKFPWFSLAHQLFRDRVGRDISVQEFKRSELLSFYNHLIEADLLIISNRNLHLMAIHQEFLKFSMFISRPLNKKHFDVFLTPVFQHLYLLIRCNSGKSDADYFIRICRGLPIPRNVINILLKCETCEELQLELYRLPRIRVKLSSNAYNILMNWFRDRFSESFGMFNILRVFHENFHLDIYQDKDDEDFAAAEIQVLQATRKWMDEYDALMAQKKSGPKVSVKTCKTPQSDVDDYDVQKKSEPEVSVKTCKTPQSDADDYEAQKKSEPEVSAETCKTPQSDDSVKTSKFKLRPAAKKVLEKARRLGWDLAQLEEALLNLNFADFYVKDDEDMDIVEDPVPKADENAGNDEDNTQAQDDIGDQDLNDENMEDDIEVQENLESTDHDMDDGTTKGIKNGEQQKGTKHYCYAFKQSYKTNFHSAYPLTISGEDVLCSSDVSSDFLYLACGFESCKISTWRLRCDIDVKSSAQSASDFKLQPLGTLRGHKGIVYALSIDSRKKTLISGSHDCTVRIWDLETSECLSEISAHSAPVYAVCASPNSKYFLSASEDKDVALFWYDDLYPVRVYSGHSMEAINCVQFHPNCAYFASASNDGNLFLFKINDDRCPVRMFHKHAAKVYTLAFSPCGKHLASADVEGMLVIWDILTCAPIKFYEAGQGIRSISYDISGSFIAAVFFYKSWKVYSVEENISPVIEAQSAGVPKSVHFSTDNKMFIVQYIEADKSEIAKTKEEPKTKIKMVN